MTNMTKSGKLACKLLVVAIVGVLLDVDGPSFLGHVEALSLKQRTDSSPPDSSPSRFPYVTEDVRGVWGWVLGETDTTLHYISNGKERSLNIGDYIIPNEILHSTHQDNQISGYRVKFILCFGDAGNDHTVTKVKVVAEQRLRLLSAKDKVKETGQKLEVANIDDEFFIDSKYQDQYLWFKVDLKTKEITGGLEEFTPVRINREQAVDQQAVDISSGRSTSRSAYRVLHTAISYLLP